MTTLSTSFEQLKEIATLEKLASLSEQYTVDSAFESLCERCDILDDNIENLQALREIVEKGAVSPALEAFCGENFKKTFGVDDISVESLSIAGVVIVIWCIAAIVAILGFLIHLLMQLFGSKGGGGGKPSSKPVDAAKMGEDIAKTVARKAEASELIKIHEKQEELLAEIKKHRLMSDKLINEFFGSYDGAILEHEETKLRFAMPDDLKEKLEKAADSAKQLVIAQRELERKEKQRELPNSVYRDAAASLRDLFKSISVPFIKRNGEKGKEFALAYVEEDSGAVRVVDPKFVSAIIDKTGSTLEGIHTYLSTKLEKFITNAITTAANVIAKLLTLSDVIAKNHENRPKDCTIETYNLELILMREQGKGALYDELLQNTGELVRVPVKEVIDASHSLDRGGNSYGEMYGLIVKWNQAIPSSNAIPYVSLDGYLKESIADAFSTQKIIDSANKTDKKLTVELYLKHLAQSVIEHLEHNLYQTISNIAYGTSGSHEKVAMFNSQIQQLLPKLRERCEGMEKQIRESFKQLKPYEQLKSAGYSLFVATITKGLTENAKWIRGNVDEVCMLAANAAKFEKNLYEGYQQFFKEIFTHMSSAKFKKDAGLSSIEFLEQQAALMAIQNWGKWRITPLFNLYSPEPVTL